LQIAKEVYSTLLRISLQHIREVQTEKHDYTHIRTYKGVITVFALHSADALQRFGSSQCMFIHLFLETVPNDSY